MNFLDTIVKTVRGIVKLRGGTDNTVIGNAGSALRVNFRNAAGTEIGVAGDPIVVSSLPSESTKATFRACWSALSLAGAPTDVINMQGSATKTIRITKIFLSANATFAAIIPVQMIRRSAANTGGTSTTPTIAKHDTTNVAATAVVRTYTANPTVGAVVATLVARKMIVSSGTNTPVDLEEQFADRPAQTIVLRGTSDFISISFGGTTVNTGSCSGYIEWTEET